MEGLNLDTQPAIELVEINSTSNESEEISQSQEEPTSPDLLHRFTELMEVAINLAPLAKSLIGLPVIKAIGGVSFLIGSIESIGLLLSGVLAEENYVIPFALTVSGFLLWVASAEISVHARYNAGYTTTDLAIHIMKSLSLLLFPPCLFMQANSELHQLYHSDSP